MKSWRMPIKIQILFFLYVHLCVHPHQSPSLLFFKFTNSRLRKTKIYLYNVAVKKVWRSLYRIMPTEQLIYFFLYLCSFIVFKKCRSSQSRMMSFLKAVWLLLLLWTKIRGMVCNALRGERYTHQKRRLTWLLYCERDHTDIPLWLMISSCWA